MYNDYKPYPCPYYVTNPTYNPYTTSNVYGAYPHPTNDNTAMSNLDIQRHCIRLKDYGPEPFIVNIEEATKQNNTFRTALWTGKHLQLTLMSIDVGDDVGLEVHPHLDQFIRIEEGQGLAIMGDSKCNMDFQRKVYDNYAILIPAGKWHNLINTGNKPLKLYSIYAPPEHPHGTVHKTKADAEADEKHHGHHPTR